MIGERRAFVPMNWGVEKITGRLRDAAATFTPRRFALGRMKSPYFSVFPGRGC
jgi:hypothetical protein